MTDVTAFIRLKYQARPHLIIEDCLYAADPEEEISFTIFSLSVFGHKGLAQKVLDLCPKYGIHIENIIFETKY